MFRGMAGQMGGKPRGKGGGGCQNREGKPVSAVGQVFIGGSQKIFRNDLAAAVPKYSM